MPVRCVYFKCLQYACVRACVCNQVCICIVCVCMCVCVYVSIKLCGYVVCIKLINAQILEVKVLRNSILVLKLFKH